MVAAADVAAATAAAAANARPQALVRVLTNTEEQRTQQQVPLDQSLARSLLRTWYDSPVWVHQVKKLCILLGYTQSHTPKQARNLNRENYMESVIIQR